MSTEECSICYETINYRNKSLLCPACLNNNCTNCFSKYLFENGLTPCCMFCKHPYSMEFIRDFLPQKFIKDYEEYRYRIYDARERSLMIIDQAELEYTDKITILNRQIKTLIRDIHYVQQEIIDTKRRIIDMDFTNFSAKYASIEEDLKDNKELLFHLQNSTSCPKNLLLKFTNKINNLTELLNIQATNMLFSKYDYDLLIQKEKELNDTLVIFTAKRDKKTLKLRKITKLAKKDNVEIKYAGRCFNETCRGFIDKTNFICSTCSVKFCKHCHEIHNDDHVCDEDVKASLTLIKKDSKPCPKCGIAISKIDGCDQMFCVIPNCQTVFSWTTGDAIKTNRIHNPEYYRFMRERNNGVIAREIDDNPCGNVGELTFTLIRTIKGNSNIWEDYFRIYLHICDEVTHLPQNFENFENKDMRVAYLRNTMHENLWKLNLKKRIKRTEKLYFYHQIFDMFTNVTEEYFRSYIQDAINITDLIAFLDKLIIYVNDEIIKVNKRYKSVEKKYLIRSNSFQHPTVFDAEISKSLNS